MSAFDEYIESMWRLDADTVDEVEMDLIDSLFEEMEDVPDEVLIADLSVSDLHLLEKLDNMSALRAVVLAIHAIRGVYGDTDEDVSGSPA